MYKYFFLKIDVKQLRNFLVKRNKMSSSSKVNYHALLQLPIVRKLKDKNKRLKDEIKVLKNVILYMESRNSNSSSCVKKEVIEILDDSSVDESDESNVNEPNNENITYSLPKEDDSKVVEFKTDGYYDYDNIKKDVQDTTKKFYHNEIKKEKVEIKEEEEEEKQVCYLMYKCSKCGFKTTNDSPDCSKCKKKILHVSNYN